MDPVLREHVRRRAVHRCEYCGLAQQREPLTFHIEHVIARPHGGADTADNLALACHHCNLHKGPNLSGLDPETGQITRLFHPRSDGWDEHFIERSGEIVGSTVIGRATVLLLKMNDSGRVELRTPAR